MYCNKPVCENGVIVVARISPVVCIDPGVRTTYLSHKLSAGTSVTNNIFTLEWEALSEHFSMRVELSTTQLFP